MRKVAFKEISYFFNTINTIKLNNYTLQLTTTAITTNIRSPQVIDTIADTNIGLYILWFQKYETGTRRRVKLSETNFFFFSVESLILMKMNPITLTQAHKYCYEKTLISFNNKQKLKQQL